MKADGSFLGYKQKPVPGSTPEPLNNFKVERKSSVGEGGLGGLGKGGGEGSGRVGRQVLGLGEGRGRGGGVGEGGRGWGRVEGRAVGGWGGRCWGWGRQVLELGEG